MNRKLAAGVLAAALCLSLGGCRGEEEKPTGLPIDAKEYGIDYFGDQQPAKEIQSNLSESTPLSSVTINSVMTDIKGSAVGNFATLTGLVFDEDAASVSKKEYKDLSFCGKGFKLNDSIVYIEATDSGKPLEEFVWSEMSNCSVKGIRVEKGKSDPVLVSFCGGVALGQKRDKAERLLGEGNAEGNVSYYKTSSCVMAVEYEDDVVAAITLMLI